MDNQNNCLENGILNTALNEIRNRKNCCCPRYIPGPTGPTGATGPTGETPTITIGTVTTGEPGSAASAVITGTAPDFVLNLTIPQGPTGPAA